MVMVLLKFLASSALLTGFYFLLFRGKSSFRASRIFLLCVPVLSLVFSLVSIDSGAKVVTLSSLLDNAADKYGPTTAPTAASAETTDLYAVGTGHAAATAEGRSNTMSARAILGAVYVLAVLTIASVSAHQMSSLKSIRRRAERRIISGSPTYFSGEITGSFSVLRSIYVNSRQPEAAIGIVISHEKQHILHRHYIDLVLMEIFTMLMWFNPFVWIIRKELRSVHEFEADQSVLTDGVQMREYMLAILEEAAGAIPVMANGINSSLIKKRFLKMKNGNKIRLRALRMALTVPFMFALLAFFAFKPAENTGDPQKNSQNPVPVEQKIQEAQAYIDTEMKNISAKRDVIQQQVSDGLISNAEAEKMFKDVEEYAIQAELNAREMHRAITEEYGQPGKPENHPYTKLSPETEKEMQEVQKYIESQMHMISAKYESINALMADGQISPKEMEARVKELEAYVSIIQGDAQAMLDAIAKNIQTPAPRNE